MSNPPYDSCKGHAAYLKKISGRSTSSLVGYPGEKASINPGPTTNSVIGGKAVMSPT